MYCIRLGRAWGHPGLAQELAMRLNMILLALSLLGSLAMAEDGGAPVLRRGFNDLRLGLATQGLEYEVEARIVAGGSSLDLGSVTDDWDSSGSVTLTYVGSRSVGPNAWGMIYGGGLAFTGSSLREGGERTSLGIVSLRGHLGAGYGISPQLHLEILPFIGLGVAELVFDDDDVGQRVSSDGYAVEAGLDFGMYYTFDNGLQLGGTLGMISSRASFSEEFIAGSTLDVDIDSSVWRVALSVGYRF